MLNESTSRAEAAQTKPPSWASFGATSTILRDLADDDLSSIELLVLAAIADRCMPPEWRANVSNATIARAIHLSERAVRGARESLEEKGWLHRERRFLDKHGGETSSWSYVNSEAIRERASRAYVGGEPSHPWPGLPVAKPNKKGRNLVPGGAEPGAEGGAEPGAYKEILPSEDSEAKRPPTPSGYTAPGTPLERLLSREGGEGVDSPRQSGGSGGEAQQAGDEFDELRAIAARAKARRESARVDRSASPQTNEGAPLLQGGPSETTTPLPPPQQPEPPPTGDVGPPAGEGDKTPPPPRDSGVVPARGRRKPKGPPSGGWRQSYVAAGFERALRNAFGAYVRAPGSFDNPATVGGFDVKAIAGQLEGRFLKKGLAESEQIYQAVHATAKALGGALDGGGATVSSGVSWKRVRSELFRACASPTTRGWMDTFAANERHARSWEARDVDDLTDDGRRLFKVVDASPFFAGHVKAEHIAHILRMADGNFDLALKALNDELAAWRERSERVGNDFGNVRFIEGYDGTNSFWHAAGTRAHQARAA